MILQAQLFRFDSLSTFVGIFIGIFSVLIIFYSFSFMKGRKRLFSYYVYMLLTVFASLGVVFSNNLLLFIVFWGVLGFLLYMLIGFGKSERAPQTAKKAFIIIGGTDAFMLLGLAIIWHMTGSVSMDKVNIPLGSGMANLAYLCLAAGAFAKAGAMPLHTWVPDTAADAPTPVSALLPASLDKLLGIYFLARITLNMFQMTTSMNTLLMLVGSVTIVAAVMMALVQHDLKRLLGYHAVSQVGYMVLGIGTGTLIGAAGALFHMLNNAIYKSCLFLGAGAVEKRAGTTALDKLGGLARVMPITFIGFLIASLAISGVPPFNGFASKWMIYQGIIKTAAGGGKLWIVWLVAAMFGSALTLASFMKLVHAIFLGQNSDKSKDMSKPQETSPTMWIPIAVLAAGCIIFGVFAHKVLGMFIFPSLGAEASLAGIWDPSLATILMVFAIAIGFVIYFLGTARKTRTVAPFVGGEVLVNQKDMRVSGTEFYNTIQEIGVLKTLYKLAEKKVFDVYEVGAKIIAGCGKGLRHIHNGVLLTYIAWCLLGMGVLFFIFLR